ncbi:MAG: aminotransferase class III-fold pyridoxal phosphate-dependent enzyme, partial [Pseudomonadales bacterium]|nr:aminotransferase class III-fold pyridoxal phosphate-dependent enzyme [Pseudomonadales bacterium]
RSLAATIASSDSRTRENFGPFGAEWALRKIPFGDLKALKKAINKNTAAFIVEPIQSEAGVIVPKPATMPVTIPRAEGFPNRTHSKVIQVNAPTEAEICVTNIAIAALPLAANALPPLKPNHPTQSIPAPVTVMVIL